MRFGDRRQSAVDGRALECTGQVPKVESYGRKVGVPFGSGKMTCPVRDVKAWLRVSTNKTGPILRPVDKHGHLGNTRLTDRGVCLVIKRALLVRRYRPPLAPGRPRERPPRRPARVRSLFSAKPVTGPSR